MRPPSSDLAPKLRPTHADTQAHFLCFCCFVLALRCRYTQADKHVPTTLLWGRQKKEDASHSSPPQGCVFVRFCSVLHGGGCDWERGGFLSISSNFTRSSVVSPGYVTRPLNFRGAAVDVWVFHWSMRISSAVGNHRSTMTVRTANSYHFPEGEMRKEKWGEGGKKKSQKCKPIETH